MARQESTGPNASDGEKSGPRSDAGSPPSLDDAAALLLGLGPEDRHELARVRDVLLEAASAGSFAPEALGHATAAADHVARVVAGEAADPESALAEAAKAIERAVEAAEAAETGQSVPASEPDEAGPRTPAQDVASPVEHFGPASDESERTSACGDGVSEGPEGAPMREGPASDGSPGNALPVRRDNTGPGLSAGAFGEPPATLPEDTDFDLLKEFVVEALDHAGSAEAALLALDTNPDDTEQINLVFQAFHTIKGTSGFLGLGAVLRLAHLAENLFARAREGDIRLTGPLADLALESCDALRFMIAGLEDLRPGEALPVPPSYEDLLERLSDPKGAGDGGGSRLGDILVAEGKVTREEVEEAAREHGDAPIGEALVKSGVASPGDVEQALGTQKRMTTRAGSNASVRVSTDRLDALVNAVGELVIAESLIGQDPDIVTLASPRLTRNVAHADKITRELQYLTMSLRMVPLKATFQKMVRLVRDLTRKSGKPVDIAIEGEDPEIDRNMGQQLSDPLVHMIRNAVDHGIEQADVRRRAGKPDVGKVRLRAYHSAGSVVIELSDDGRGLDRVRIYAKAVERGLIEPGRDLTDNEVFGCIFRPGFSTAEKVTSISGRGVGMDVVRERIESLHGRVDVTSVAGQGSTFTLRLPLTMAITDAMIVRVGVERYLLPTLSIEQSFRPEPGAVSTVVNCGEMVMLRSDLIPVVRLHRLFDVESDSERPSDGVLVVVEAEGGRAALMVDELLGQQQVVIKALGQGLGELRGVSGGTILGDGRVGLILDPAGIMKLVGGRMDSVHGPVDVGVALRARETALAAG